jgi:RNA polymerase sigma-70 factor (ECF subfamily)
VSFPPTFPTTRWSLVLRAARDDAAGNAALAELCAAYWPPVHAFYRRLGLGPEAARDLTQGLFADLLERGDLRRGEPGPGSFRSFLRGCARHWLANERERELAQKRGGGRVFAVDWQRETERTHEPASAETAEAAFERRWAETVIGRALAQLELDEQAARRGPQFASLRPVLDGGGPPEPWAAIARQLGTTEGALKVAAHRLKARFRDCLCAEVRQTLPDGSAEGDELRELLQALGGARKTAAGR